MRYAIVKSGAVVNVIEWDGTSNWTPPQDAELVACEADVSPGHTYTKKAGFTAPLVQRTPAQQAPVAPIEERLTRLLAMHGLTIDDLKQSLGVS